MTNSLSLFGISFLVLLATVAAVLFLWPDVLPAPPDAGERGIQRKRGLEHNDAFRRIAPLLRVLSQYATNLPFGNLRARAEAAARQAGFPLGINGNDLLGISMATAVIGAAIFAALAAELNRAVQGFILAGIIFGAAFPWFKLQDIAKHRMMTICRGLPGVVDLISLGMESGLDFMNAMRQTANRLSEANPLRFELEHMLHKMSLGQARSDVLVSFSERILAPSIQQFTTAVIQAEKRGTPLAEVLAVQARVQRTKRSQAAEQAAARAAVLLILPLMLIFACVFIIIMGPFIVQFVHGDLF